MINLLKEEANKTETLNGAVTNISSGKFCLDLFSSIGASRNLDEQELVTRFHRAFCENKNLAMKILFYARDIRGGLGERKVFRTIIKNLPKTSRSALVKNIKNIAEYGRYDDLLELMDTSCKKEVTDFIKEQLKQDLANLETNNISLLAKWLPSINASNFQTVQLGKRLAQGLNMSEKEYRQTLSKLRAKIKIIENNLRTKDYSFDYSKQPSKAMFKYKKAFIRNDKERYDEFLNKVKAGKAKMNTGTLYPYEIVRTIIEGIELSDDEKKSLDVTWNALPNYAKDENALVVVDGSGSMYWSPKSPLPAQVAQSLGIYFAERNTGIFKNHFITFSENPRLIEIKGDDIYNKVRYCMGFDECANTNIQKVFELILNTAVKNKLPQKDMPETVYIISDMEFDICTRDASLTNFEYAKQIFSENGYKLPKLVFWNVNSWQQQVPVKANEQGVLLVSGCTPKIFEMVMNGETSPYKFMLDILNSERYEKITA
ncbi:MAG: DUF2828 family protein [Candidatus Gastranaerophilales bacterium]|nr:DUF2828 family protein [Candidatus Gastranaerophilales bacterium]